MEKKVKHKTSRKLMFAWPMLGMGLTIVTLMAGYTKFFATNFLGVSASTVGALMAAAAVFDGFTDIVAGYFIDRTSTKLGKGRPYQIAFIGLAVANALVFSVPKMSYVATCVYIFTMYAMESAIFRTLLECSEPVYMANSIDDPQDAINLSSINGTMALIIGMICGIVLPQVIKNFGTTRQGWAAIGWVIAILTSAMAMIRVSVVKEKKRVTISQEKLTIKGFLQAITANKYIMLVALMIFLSAAGTGIQMDIVAYYAQFILGDLGTQSILGLGNLFPVIMMIIAPMISKKIGMTNVLKITAGMTLAGALLRLVNPTNLGIVFLGTLLASCGFNITVTFANVLVINCIDYGEWKTGKRTEGSLACAKSVTNKIGTAVASGLFGLLLGLSKYDGTAAVQAVSATKMIIAMYTIVPAIFAILLLVVLHFYDLEKKLPQIREEVAARNNAAQQEN